MKAHKTYEVFQPSIVIEIEHGGSGEKRRVACEGRNRCNALFEA